MKKKYIWLFAENHGDTADNNSFYFWQHVVDIKDDIDKYFLLTRNKKNKEFYKTLSSREKKYILWKNSIKHYRIYFSTDIYIVTLGGKDVVPDKLGILSVKFSPQKPLIRLGHGNLAIKKVGYEGVSYTNNLIRTLYFNPIIKETFMEQNNFKDYQLYYSDYLPRYKELFRRESKRVKDDTKRIVWFLTWREYFGENIETILFMHQMRYIFKDQRLHDYMGANKVQFTICLHQFFDTQKMEPLKPEFEKLGIIVKYATEIDVMDEVVNNDVLITDYSSIGFDFTILDKPVIMYQPDLEEYLSLRELYCSIEELKEYSLQEPEQLVDCLVNETYQVNPFFKKRSAPSVNPEYVMAGKHIDKMYESFAHMQRHKVTFLGYNFFGAGGTVFATRALAEALMEQGYLVELRSLKRNGFAMGLPYGLNASYEYDSPSKRKSDVIKRNLFRFDRFFHYLNYDKNKKNLVPFAEISLRRRLKKIHSETVISTRESLHFFLKDASSPFIKNKIYFYHCPAEIFDMNFPGAMEQLKKIKIGKAVFVTENNRELFIQKYGLENYDQYIVLGNALESYRCKSRSEIHTVEKKDVYRGIYLVRIDQTRKEDLDNLLDFGRYLKERKIFDIKIDVYGTGGYMNQFLDILYDEELMDYIVVKGVTDDVKTEMERHDAVVDFSKNHSFGMPYIEGILNGKMVYCMKNTGSAEVLSEFPECYIQSYDDLVEKMRRLPEIPLEQLQKYYDVISEKYSRETVGKKFIDYLNR